MHIMSVILGLLASSSSASAMDLSVDPLIEGDTVQLTIVGAPPNTAVVIVRSAFVPVPGVTCPPVLQGVCLDLAQPTLLVEVQTDAGGYAEYSFTLPNAVNSRNVWFQAAARDGSDVSPVVARRLLQDCGPSNQSFGRWYTNQPAHLAYLVDCGRVASDIEWLPVNGALPALPNLVEAQRISARPAADTQLTLRSLRVGGLEIVGGAALQTVALPAGTTLDHLILRDLPALQSVQLPKLIRVREVVLQDVPALAQIGPFPGLDSIDVLHVESAPSSTLVLLDPSWAPQVVTLASLAWLTDLSALAGHVGIESLTLNNLPIVDLTGMPAVPRPELVLELNDLRMLNSLNGFVPPSGLFEFSLINVPLLTDLSPLLAARSLGDLTIKSQPGLTDLSDLSGIPLLSDVELVDLPNLTTLADLAPGLARGAAGNLADVSIFLGDLPALTSLAGLEPLSNVIDIELWNLPLVDDLTPLANLVAVDHELSITGLSTLPSLHGLQGLATAASMDLSGNPLLNDVSALGGMTGSMSIVRAERNVSLCINTLDLALANVSIFARAYRDNGVCP
jgi:hypothetical protein